MRVLFLELAVVFVSISFLNAYGEDAKGPKPSAVPLKKPAIEKVFKDGTTSRIGLVLTVKGDVFILHSKDPGIYMVKEKINVFEKDTITTEGNGAIQLALKDGSIVTMSSNSKLILSQSMFDAKKKSRNVILDALSGKIRFVVNKLEGFRKTGFKVKTFTATLGVRGSDFIVSALPELTEVSTLKNTELELASLAFPDRPVILKEFEKSVVKKGMLPTEPVKVPPADVDDMKKVFGAIPEIGLMAAKAASSLAAPGATPSEPERFTLMRIAPANQDDAASINTDIVLNFNKTIKKESVTARTITLSLNGVVIEGAFNIDDRVVIYKPLKPLHYNRAYQVKISKDVSSVSGDSLEKDLLFNFSTAGLKKTSMIVEVGNIVTFGKFSVKDKTVKIHTESINPMLGFEYLFKNGRWGAGIDLSKTQNKITGSYNDENEDGEGAYRVTRRELSLYSRYIVSETLSLKLGYCYFNYNFKEGEIEMREGGSVVKRITEFEAESKMKKGIMAEINFTGGKIFQFALGLQYKYFFGADYKLDYKEEVNPPGTKVSVEETASLSAHSARIRPEFSFLPLENMRVFVNVTIAGSYWVGGDTGIFDDLKAYSGVDIYTGIAGGIRLYF